jgi:hypothetical protein
MSIGPSPNDIPADKLTQLIEHIGGKKGNITEKEFRFWMTDIHLPFLSEFDLVHLWKDIDSKGSTIVTAVEFIMFLHTCEREFSEVRKEVENMSKCERLKFTARDLSDFLQYGKEGARKKEFEVSRMARQNMQMHS